MNEIWIPIKGYEELYDISNYGRVRCHDYKKQGITKILRTHARLGNYVKVRLRKGDEIRYHRVHRLVAFAFLPPPQQGQIQVEHLNCDKRDNRVENLRWTSPKGNMANPLTRYHMSISHLSPSAEIRARYSAGQRRRFARERETMTGRYAAIEESPHIVSDSVTKENNHFSM